MSEKLNSQKAARSFAVRNIKKDFNEPTEYDTVTTQFHIELGDKNETIIVEDRPVDWVEKSLKDMDQVGLANVLKIAERQGISALGFAFNDSEAVDTSFIDPMDPNAVSKIVSAGSDARKKLEETAKSLGVSVDDLVNAAVQGTLSELIGSKISSGEDQGKDKEGGAE